MTQQPFSRPGAIDLSGLKRQAGAPSSGVPVAGEGSAPASSAYSVQVDAENIQDVIQASMTAPVILVFYSTSRAPDSVTMAQDVATVAGEYDGRFLAALVDIDQAPEIAQMMQIQTVPLLLILLDGRPASQPLQGLIPLDELRSLFNQFGQQLTAQGIAGRHQPRSAAPADEVDEDGEPPVDPRYQPAQDALEAGDIDGAVAAYQKLVDANPADAEAAAGLAMAKVLLRTQDVDLDAARAEAAAKPDDVDAQTLVADLDLLGGHVDDAFDRLVDVVRRTDGADRDQARQHLLGLFAAVGNDDPRVLKGRQKLANALF